MSALLGPTNTGKTHRAIEQLLSHRTGMIGLPLRLLAREVYDRVTARIGEQQVALVTGEEKRVPRHPRYWICTVESMPVDREVDFVCVDEIQLAGHRQRGHTFTDRLLNVRGLKETWFLGSDTMQPALEELVPTAYVQRHPRLSKLSYGGVVSMGALPPRTAVVAFSVAEVYELAEHLRQRHGGTAVVLGALSPRARNAQVAMYESGEVEYMVATDAIGMGLNLDLDRVVFASTSKYDGRESRPLSPAELGQIAGRAGRYTRDGSFAVLRPNPPLEDRVVHAVQTQAFEPQEHVVWRNGNLDFGSADDLVASLRVRPQRGRRLRMLEQADDFDALSQLVRLSSVRRRARGAEAVSLLWDVCRIPDFRKLMLESHVQLLARIYDQVSGESGQLDEDWMRRRIERLDDVAGDIDTLMTRMAFIRTWTYIANHEQWVPNAAAWQERTRAIEDRTSDALHERLTERFVAKTVGTPTRPAGTRRPQPRRASSQDEAPDPNSPFAALAGLTVTEPPSEGDEALERVHAIVEAEHEAFAVGERGELLFDGVTLGAWRSGADVMHPRVQLDDGAWTAGAGRRIERRLQAWTADVARELVGALDPLLEASEPAVRGVAYQMRRGLGTLPVREVRAQLEGMRASEREALEGAGILVGQVALYLLQGMRPRALRVRRALCWVSRPWSPEHGIAPDRPAWPVPEVELQSELLAALGFVQLGPLAIRADLAERAAAAIAVEAATVDPFPPPEFVQRWLECSARELTGVLRGLGYRDVAGGLFHRPPTRRARS